MSTLNESAPRTQGEAVTQEARDMVNDLHREWISDNDNDGTYTLELNEEQTDLFFANLLTAITVFTNGHIARCESAAVAAMREENERLAEALVSLVAQCPAHLNETPYEQAVHNARSVIATRKPREGG